MKRLATVLPAAVALVLPGVAEAKFRELGATPEGIPPASCPADCTAIGKVTGFQVANGAKSHPMRVNEEGKIVGFTVRLGKPSNDQIQFFERLFGRPPRVRLSVLRPATPKRGYKLKRQSEEFNVQPYFGSAPTFALSKPLPIGVKYEVALTTDTWAPTLAVGRSAKEGWRSSRSADNCDNVQQPAAHEAIGSRRRYGCLHSTARLTYTVLFIPDPRPAKKSR